jgi:hypothetical protein
LRIRRGCAGFTAGSIYFEAAVDGTVKVLMPQEIWILTHHTVTVTMPYKKGGLMPDIVARLRSGLASGSAEPGLLEAALGEITDLRMRRDALEEILIILVRTGIPWDADGVPGDSFAAFRERYQRAMHEASDLLGLEMRSSITRTEPRT